MRSTDVSSSRPTRHARVWLDPSTWRSHLRSSHDARALSLLDDWIAKSRPAVACRRDACASDACALGIALPLAQGRVRIAFVVDARAVARVAPPLRLDEVIATAPIGWQAALHDLVVRSQAGGTAFFVYGSLAWQHVAGEPCVTPSSDVDLLWAARDVSHIERTLALLATWEQAWERKSVLRADGELLLMDGGACAWRELLCRPERVLIKTDDGVAMRLSPLRPAGKAA